MDGGGAPMGFGRQSFLAFQFMLRKPMSAESDLLNDQIKQSVALLRRHL